MNLKFQRAIVEEAIMKDIVEKLGWNYLNTDQIRCVFSKNTSTSRVIGRIWSTPRIFSEVFETKPMYVIELIDKRYSNLSDKDKVKVIIHELLHIPKTFSGALSPHKNMAKTLNCKTVDALLKEYYLRSGKELKEESIVEKFVNFLR
ncbi:MAG: putative metallopeptidase [Candidatus Nanoarchaeia archaeon]|nr:putative metallopeptidase [Candidatus Nanoarchaeia archaeon]